VGTVQPGVVRIVRPEGDEVRVAVHGGFTQVEQNVPLDAEGAEDDAVGSRVTLLIGVAELATEIDAARLRVGMIAVYVNRFGEKVAHRIISPVAGGWQVKVIITDPLDLETLDMLRFRLNCELVPSLASKSKMRSYIEHFARSDMSIDAAVHEITSTEDAMASQLAEKMGAEVLDEDSAPIIRLVTMLITEACKLRASDIHIETYDDSVHIKYRIDGVLQEAMAPIAREHHSTILSRIKIMSELDIAERRVPQDGRFRVRYKGRMIDFRVSIMPTIHGENAVLRVLDKESMSEKFHNLTLDVVGFAEEDLKRFRAYIREPYGMVLVTGPTGSGKTTTLYTALAQAAYTNDPATLSNMFPGLQIISYTNWPALIRTTNWISYYTNKAGSTVGTSNLVIVVGSVTNSYITNYNYTFGNVVLLTNYYHTNTSAQIQTVWVGHKAGSTYYPRQVLPLCEKK